MNEWFRKRTFGMLPAAAAARWGMREALVFGDRRWTFDEFASEVDHAAKALIALGVSSGEKVALWMNNKPEWLFLMYAVWKIDAVLVPLNTRYRMDDIRYVLKQSNAGTLISDDRSGPVDYCAMVAEVLPDTSSGPADGHRLEGFPDLRCIVFVGDDKLPGTLSLAEVLAGADAIPDEALAERAATVDPDGLALMGYTSGTTGDPKGVMHSHINIRNVMERGAILGITFTDVHINYLPLFHIYALSEIALVSIVTGAKQVLMESFDPAEALRLIESERCTLAHGFDTHWQALLEAQADAPRNVSSLRLGTLPSGTEATISIAEQVQDVLCPTVSGYGMTEIWAFVSISFPTDTREQRVNTSGSPVMDCEFHICDPDTGAEQPLGEAGELRVRGYNVMQGYYDQPEATADNFSTDNWFRTGDMAKLREDGRFVFMGRYKDMLKVGGENVSPAEVEARLMTLPGIAQVAVVGYPDPRLHEVAVAFVVRNGESEVTTDHVIAHLRGRIASFKLPRHVLFVDDFPMTSSGKIQKVKLRQYALDVLGEPARSAGT